MKCECGMCGWTGEPDESAPLCPECGSPDLTQVPDEDYDPDAPGEPEMPGDFKSI